MLLLDIINKLESASPIDAAMEWDNVGLLVGDASVDVRKVYIALDATDDVIAHAIDAKADMLITHHPLIFSGMKRITSDDFIGRRIISLIQNDIAYYAMHTNFDVYGMGALAEDRLELDSAVPLDISHEEEGMGRIGNLHSPLTLRDLAADVKKKFHIPSVRVYGDLDREISKVAVMPGSGKSEIDNALMQGAEVLITGDIGHHDGIDAIAKGISIIDAGHYGLEHLFIDYIASYLEDCDIDVAKEDIENPYSVI